MVRVARFGWHDAGPVGRDLELGDWLTGPDEDTDLKPRTRPTPLRRSRRRVRTSSPVDRVEAANERSADEIERVA